MDIINQNIRWFDAREYSPSADGYYLVAFVNARGERYMDLVYIGEYDDWGFPDSYTVLAFAEVQMPHVEI